MKKEAEANEEADNKFRELIEARNMADQLVMATEKTIKENEDKLEGNEKADIEAAIEEVKKVKDGDSIEDIRSAIDKLSKESEGFATRIYQAASQQANASNSENKNDSDDNIVEAEEVK